MVSWFQYEVDFAKQVHDINVEDLGFGERDDKGVMKKPLKTIPVMDLTNDEMILLQQDPDIADAPGSITDAGTPRGQIFGILLTYRRMAKGYGGRKETIPFGEETFRKFTTTRTGALAKRISEGLGAVQKKPKSSEPVE